MAKQECLTVKGEITEAGGDSNYKILLENGLEVKGRLSGKMRQNFIKVLVGDKVEVEMSPYDLTRCRITRRLR